MNFPLPFKVGYRKFLSAFIQKICRIVLIAVEKSFIIGQSAINKLHNLENMYCILFHFVVEYGKRKILGGSPNVNTTGNQNTYRR